MRYLSLSQDAAACLDVDDFEASARSPFGSLEKASLRSIAHHSLESHQKDSGVADVAKTTAVV